MQCRYLKTVAMAAIIAVVQSKVWHIGLKSVIGSDWMYSTSLTLTIFNKKPLAKLLVCHLISSRSAFR